jgi:non-ribosomal peptide synthetase component F
MHRNNYHTFQESTASKVSTLEAAKQQTTLASDDRAHKKEKSRVESPAHHRAAAKECTRDLHQVLGSTRFAEQVNLQPDAPAIYAWDDEMTYNGLDELSDRVAGQFVRLGVKPDVVVPLYFEKSLWTIVAMLAVLKVGGAFVLLDGAHLENRYRAECS